MLAVAFVSLALMAVLQLALGLEWAAAVPGVPRWLHLVAGVQLALVLGGALLLARAFALRAASR